MTLLVGGVMRLVNSVNGRNLNLLDSCTQLRLRGPAPKSSRRASPLARRSRTGPNLRIIYLLTRDERSHARNRHLRSHRGFQRHVQMDSHFSSGFPLELSNGLSVACSDGFSLMRVPACNLLPRLTEAAEVVLLLVLLLLLL